MAGGLGSAVLEWMAAHGHRLHVVRLGLPDTFVEHGTPAELYKIVGLDKEHIKEVIQADDTPQPGLTQ